jgi:hypothetical protein
MDRRTHAAKPSEAFELSNTRSIFDSTPIRLLDARRHVGGRGRLVTLVH